MRRGLSSEPTALDGLRQKRRQAYGRCLHTGVSRGPASPKFHGIIISAMLDAANHSAIERLRNGLRLEIRALRPDDRADLLAAIDRTSAGSLFRRFFAAK